MRIGLDIDNTIYPLADEMQEYFSYRLGVELPREIHWDSHSLHWGLSKNQYHQLITDGINIGLLFHNASAYAGASEATRALTEAGHTIVIVTARKATTLCKKVTRDWLLRERIWYDELIFNENKAVGETDVFLDDKPTNIPTLILAGQNAVYFDQPWNRHLPYPRVRSWAEFVDYVKEYARVQEGR